MSQCGHRLFFTACFRDRSPTRKGADLGKYFLNGTKHASFERMMMEVPKGPGRTELQKKPPKRKLQRAYQKKGMKE